MKEALVIHPRMTELGGGEMLSLHVCKALQESGFQVSFASDSFAPYLVNRVWPGLGPVMDRCKHIPIPSFRPHLGKFLMLQRLPHLANIQRELGKFEGKLVFSTQSGIFSIPNHKTYHFLYDISAVLHSGDTIAQRAYYWMLRCFSKQYAQWFFAASHRVLRDLRHNGYPNSSILLPPFQPSFRPRPKNPYVVQAIRIIPTKRPELYLEVARRLHNVRFVLVGRLSTMAPEQYFPRVLSEMPPNMQYVEAPIRKVPHLLEEAKVYLHTGNDAGVAIAVMEALSAGCYPVIPSDSGSAELVPSTHAYETVEEAVALVKLGLKSQHSPETFAESVKPYSADAFEKQIANLASHA